MKTHTTNSSPFALTLTCSGTTATATSSTINLSGDGTWKLDDSDVVNVTVIFPSGRTYASASITPNAHPHNTGNSNAPFTLANTPALPATPTGFSLTVGANAHVAHLSNRWNFTIKITDSGNSIYTYDPEVQVGQDN